MMTSRPVSLIDQIRRAVDESGMSRYRICKLIGIAESTMSRFMAGEGLGQENINALASLLGLSIVVKKRAKMPTDKKGT